jgi:hypothetical protein
MERYCCRIGLRAHREGVSPAVVPPEVLVVGEEAVYCGRNSEGLLPDSMVCRIDRRTLQAAVRVFPGVSDLIVAQPCYHPPDGWTIADRPLEVLDL